LVHYDGNLNSFQYTKNGFFETELKNDCACVTSDPVGKAVGAKISIWATHSRWKTIEFLDFSVKFQSVFRYETVLFKRYFLASYWSFFCESLKLIWFTQVLSELNSLGASYVFKNSTISVICFPVFPRKLETCAIVFQLCHSSIVRDEARKQRKRSTHTMPSGYRLRNLVIFRRRRQPHSHFMTRFAYGNPVKIVPNSANILNKRKTYPVQHMWFLRTTHPPESTKQGLKLVCRNNYWTMGAANYLHYLQVPKLVLVYSTYICSQSKLWNILQVQLAHLSIILSFIHCQDHFRSHPRKKNQIHD